MSIEGELSPAEAPAASEVRSGAAEREEARRVRRRAKADRVDGWAESRRRQADAQLGRAREMRSVIPLGQPILTDHYSAGRDTRYRARAGSLEGKGYEAQQMATRHAHRAERIRRWEEERLTAPVTIRRITKLEAEQRSIARDLTGVPSWDTGEPMIKKPSPEWEVKLTARAAEVADELGYWRGHLKELEQTGVKVWGPADVKKGDAVLLETWGWVKVARVNAKSVSFHADGRSWTNKADYSKVREVHSGGTETS